MATILVIVMTNVAMGSVNVFVKKALDGGINHMVIATYRLIISALFLAPFAYLWERASLTQYFFLLGLSYTSATLACAFVSLLPAITFTLAVIFRTETLNVKRKSGIIKILGTLICIGGALLLTFYKGLPISKLHSQSEGLNRGDAADRIGPQTKARDWLLGCLFMLLGAAFLASWLLYQAKINVKYPCKYSSTVLMSVFAAFQSALLSFTKNPRGVESWILRDKFVILVVIYAGVVGQAMSTVATSWAIKKRGPVFTSTFYPVVLISATLLDFIVLHNQLFLGSIIGSVITISGLYIFLWGKNKDVEAVSTTTELSSEPEIQEHNCKIESEDNSTKLPV